MKSRSGAHKPRATIPAPLVWTFDGAFASCLADAEDALRRVLVQVGDVSGIAVLFELSLPALQERVASGESIQPAWGDFLEVLGLLRRSAETTEARRG